MDPSYKDKSSLEDIRRRFDADVDRFSNLETGQSATVDAVLAMELITGAAHAVTSPIHRLLDVGCGAGNNSLKLLAQAGPFDVDLLDLSRPMLDRAETRVTAATSGVVRTFQTDLLSFKPDAAYDVILAAAVLHHLRDEEQWHRAFRNFHDWLRPGGSLWITDLVAHEIPQVESMMRERYAHYLDQLGGPSHHEAVFAYIEKEDSPRPVTFQLDMLRSAGFSRVELLHKNTCFAAFGAIREARE